MEFCFRPHCVGVTPSELLLRVNQTFHIDCCVDVYEGELDFFVDYNVSVSELQDADSSYSITVRLITKLEVSNSEYLIIYRGIALA